MLYRKDKYGNDLSVLGFGCMRFQQKLGKIDMQKAEQQIMAAIAGGVNYLIPPISIPAARLPSARSLRKTVSGIRSGSPPSCPIT